MITAELAAYAKSNGRWLDDCELPTPQRINLPIPEDKNDAPQDLNNHAGKHIQSSPEPALTEENKVDTSGSTSYKAEDKLPKQDADDNKQKFTSTPPKSRINPTSKSKNLIKSSEESKEKTDILWGPNRKMRILVKKYVEKEATKQVCKCLPIHMRNIVLDLEDSEGKMLIDTDALSEAQMLDYIKELYIDNNLTRSNKGRPPKNTCPIHSDKKGPKH